jgi:hypothetical protein
MSGVTASTFVDALFAPVNTRPLSGAHNFWAIQGFPPSYISLEEKLRGFKRGSAHRYDPGAGSAPPRPSSSARFSRVVTAVLLKPGRRSRSAVKIIER